MFPLEGIKVLDFTVAVSGAVGSQMLGDMGADIIKVEPLEGDFMRLTATRHEDSPRWMGVNRNKRSLSVNLKDDRGRQIVLKLAQRADVLMHNFRPGVMERLGLGYEDVVKVNPKVVYIEQFGFGKTGPMSRWVGGDMWAQAMGGVVSTQGSPNAPPYVGGVCWVDQGTGIVLALAAMLALFVRERVGIGQQVHTNLLDACLAMQTGQIGDYLIDGQPCFKGGRGWAGNFPYGAYTAKDGEVMIIFGSTNEEWAKLCELLGIQHLLNDPRYDTPEKRKECREELYLALDRAFSKKTRQEWQELFHVNKTRADPCLTYEELFAHPQVEANQIVVSVKHPVEGVLKMIGTPIKLEKTPGGIVRHPPLLGEHTKQILLELGYRDEEIEELSAHGVISARTQ